MEGTLGETMREPQRGAETPSPPAAGQAAREVCRDFLKVRVFTFLSLDSSLWTVPERVTDPTLSVRLPGSVLP